MCLEVRKDLFKHSLFPVEAKVAAMLNDRCHRHVTLRKLFCQVKVSGEFAQADGTEQRRLFVSFLDLIRPVHQTLKVRAMRHPEDVAKFVAGRFHRSVLEEVLAIPLTVMRQNRAHFILRLARLQKRLDERRSLMSRSLLAFY